MSTYPVNPNDSSSPSNSQGAKQGAEELRALKLKIQQVVAGAFISSAAGANPADIVTFIQPDPQDRPSMVAGGWLPWSLNQQWGGAGCMPFHMIDAATGAEFKFDSIDCHIDDDGTTGDVGQVAGNFYRFQGILPAKNLLLQAVWIKLYKVANPVDNLILRVQTSAAGLPVAAIQNTLPINGKQITSDTNGQWYRFIFAAPPALVAGIQYVITLEKSAGVDAVNYYRTKLKGTTKYPNNIAGTGSAVPVYVSGNTNTTAFICEAISLDQSIQVAGQFTGFLKGNEGTPINRSVAWNKPLREFFPLFHPNGWSILIRGKNWTKDRTIFEAIYGLHHDRINVRCAAATGFTTVTIYEQDGTVNTVVGTSDISTAGYKDVLIVGRSMNDGGDYCKIYTGVGGVWTKEVEAITQIYTFDPLMLKQGTAWIMGGFQLFSSATYTKLNDMTILPSADGWTFTTTTATVEGNVFVVSGGKLNQIKAGMAAGGDGNYLKTAAAFNNANGWLASWKKRIVSASNTISVDGLVVHIEDGTKQYSMQFGEFYFSANNRAVVNANPQNDFKSTDNTYFLTGKGSDVLIFNNGRLITDITGLNTTASANNQLRFGDNSIVANENADVIWDYIGYYNTANIYPQFTAGELHEFAVFSGDKNLLGQAVYNLGVPFSLKQYCGIQKNYVGEVIPHQVTVNGVTLNPTTASTAFPPTVLMPDMECFILGSRIECGDARAAVTNNTADAQSYAVYSIDGVAEDKDTAAQSISVGGGFGFMPTGRIKDINFGLHKIELRWGCSAGTATASSQRRQMAPKGIVK